MPAVRAGRGPCGVGILSETPGPAADGPTSRSQISVPMDDPKIAALDAVPTTTEERAPRGALLTVFLVVVIDLLGFAIVLPLLPRIAEAYLQGKSKAIVGLTIGLLFS